MARCAAYVLASGAGSATLPIASLYAPATQDLRVREVGVFNTTTTAAGLKLIKVSTTGTQGATITETNLDTLNHTILGTAFNTHSVAPTLGGEIAPCPVGAAIGAGTILTFYGENNGILIPQGTGNGLAVLPTGTGQICQVYFIWDE